MSESLFGAGMREAHPAFCWRLLNGGKRCCILDRGHDDGAHEPQDPVVASDLSREGLIAICEDAIAPEQWWFDRDSAAAHKQLGQCWAWLKAGCEFRIHDRTKDPDDMNTSDSTIRLTVCAEGFAFHDWGGERDEETFYIPTRAAITKAAGKDWYGVRV